MARKDKAAEAETQTEDTVQDTSVETQTEDGDEAATAEVKTTKSIVPAGWKSKNDELKQFIDAQSTGKDGFEMTAFFALCRKNLGGSLTEEKVAHYEAAIANKEHGAPGRSKMTLRNMLATIARKNGKLVGLDGTETEINLPKPAVTGAAAKAQEAAGADTAAA